MKPFEYVCAALLFVVALFVVPWSYNHWMQVTGPSVPAGPSIAVTGSPSISASQADSILCTAKSPACGTGYTLYQYGTQYGIDPGFALAVFRHESSYGTAGVARSSLSLGNLRCIPDAECVGGYAYFPSWQAGYTAFYKLISGPMYVGSGLVTPSQIMPKYAPSGDGNNPTAYATDVEQSIASWRTA